MRVFLDTNILLDIIEGRQKFLLASPNGGIPVMPPETFLNEFFGKD